jgi:hypothetical protein
VNKRGLGLGEKILLFFACLVALGSAYLFFNNQYIQNLFHVYLDDSLAPIGTLKSKEGKIQRETVNDSGFNDILSKSTLFNNDVIMTGSDGTAIVSLNNEGELKLSPNTMIRLNLEYVKNDSGQLKNYKIEVLNGEVSAEASPKDFKSEILLTSKNKKIRISHGKTVNENIEKNQKKDIDYPEYTKPVEKINLAPPPTPTPTPIVTPTPLPIQKVKPIPKPVKAVPPAIPAPQAKCPVNGLQISISKNIPDQNGRKEVLLTWKKSAVEDYYDVQIATDSNFRNIVDSHQSQSNFYSFIKLTPSNYWWRLRARTKGGSSDYSKAQWFRLNH